MIQLFFFFITAANAKWNKTEWASPKPFCSIMCHGLLGRGYKLLSSTLVLEEISWLVGNQSLWILIAMPAEVITSNINNSVHLLVEFSVMLKVKWMPQGCWVFVCGEFFFPAFCFHAPFSFLFLCVNPAKSADGTPASVPTSFFSFVKLSGWLCTD